jgi:GntR family transcriptional repressor for pyruvate dehydrogenase complex
MPIESEDLRDEARTSKLERLDVQPAKRKSSISNHIVTEVLGQLFDGKLKAGDFLGTEKHLMDAFGASRLPIREALGRLESMGVVEITTGMKGGARISASDPELIANLISIQFLLSDLGTAELFDARIAIEPDAVELVAQRASDEGLAGLRTQLAEIEEMLGPDVDFPLLVARLLDFHIALIELSGNRALTGMMRALLRNLHNIYLRLGKPDTVVIGLRRLHTILDLLANRDGRGAAAISRLRLEEQKEAWVERERLMSGQ